jgi:hypothetical protein
LNNEEKNEKLLNSGVSAMAKERQEIVEHWCFNNGENVKNC